MKEKDLMNELNIMLAKAMREKYKKLLDGRPLRDKPIEKEDIINLKIALNLSKNLDDFLDRV